MTEEQLKTAIHFRTIDTPYCGNCKWFGRDWEDTFCLNPQNAWKFPEPEFSDDDNRLRFNNEHDVCDRFERKEEKMSDDIDNKDGWHLWPLADVLSVESDRLLCGDMGEMYEFLNWMTGDNLYTHQLVRAMDVCKPFLEDKIDWLKGCMDGGTDKDKCLVLLGKLMVEHDEYIEVPRLPEGAWESRNPLVELFEMMNGKGDEE